MKKQFTMIVVACAMVSIIFYSAVQADDSEQPQPSYQSQSSDEQGQRPGRRGNRRAAQSLTDEQIAQVAEILSQYDASSLTAEDARAINDAFREAGIRQGPGQQEAIEAAGFDPRVISSLDPPPDRGGQGPPRQDKGGQGRPQRASQQGQQSRQANQ
ncbi:hypothetical protein QUF90_26665 [Desulfococcaceae bacterium HSG9]|nr:hypothetical protein [Desulfococcaceae bacterium HSG9]